ncbi:hypothetical protein FJ959_22120 [Mesorhizobium sp. B2-2-4]|uniref:hypothetical protein n=1 Tax=unclassified Mesorhizobium TaxID=325217 RepID=UPI00112BE069|nr:MULTISPECIES: hypothetical protein [unclassified Mesorhizobium]TPM53231.1 hypothetical protein FJ959_22120 [Mesorhizobium sp. B2-2-4]TPM62127.1 hypothetical protein FJ965_21250 [Mesorhizobium sp. B2-2-1]TPN68498.1 hypothetical protein FJ984_11730 [Mesorhizobium sp. B1-1-3]
MTIERIEKELRDGLDKVTPGPWFALGPKGSESCGGGTIATTPTYQDQAFAPLADIRSWSAGITQEEANRNAAHIARCSPDNIRDLLSEIERLREDVLAVYDECESVAVPHEEGSFQQVEAYRRTIRALKARALTIPGDKEGGDHG